MVTDSFTNEINYIIDILDLTFNSLFIMIYLSRNVGMLTKISSKYYSRSYSAVYYTRLGRSTCRENSFTRSM